ncbi:flagellar hook-length control protein [Pyxidicoccus fallax]|nr:flagellar hook-length control protein [Pyxidicoccus fallax]
MTWGKWSHSAGVDRVGCLNCDPYRGETSCSNVLPVLCINQDGSPVPPGITPDFYNGWARGNIATTLPVSGTSLTSLAVANQLCASAFGAGWRMAEFHDGNGGWNWYAYGNVRSDMRFWVHINDNAGNCWNP